MRRVPSSVKTCDDDINSGTDAGIWNTRRCINFCYDGYVFLGDPGAEMHRHCLYQSEDGPNACLSIAYVAKRQTGQRCQSAFVVLYFSLQELRIKGCGARNASCIQMCRHDSVDNRTVKT